MKKRISIITIGCVLFLAALGVTFYPLISNYVNNKYQSEIQTQYETCVEEMGESRLRDLREAARNYNDSLNTVQYNKEGLQIAAQEYDDILNPDGNGIMGYVEIPKISVYLPIYHNSDAMTLEDGVGHLIGSSLPIGGGGTHSVLSAHSGVAGKKLFSDLDQLSAGDVFYLHVLDETLAYRVDEINTVLPHDSSLLGRTAKDDRCTLITCTPFGVNTHRLLVQGSRTTYEEAKEIEAGSPVATPSTWSQQYMRGLMLGGAIIICVLLGFFLILFIKKRRKHK